MGSLGALALISVAAADCIASLARTTRAKESREVSSAASPGLTGATLTIAALEVMLRICSAQGVSVKLHCTAVSSAEGVLRL